MDTPDKPQLGWLDLWRAAKVPLSFVGENRREALFLLLLALVSAGAGATVPYATGRFIDGLIALAQQKDQFSWFAPLALWFVVVLLSAVIDWRLDTRAARLGNYVYCLASYRWYSSLLFLPITFHKTQRGGEILNKISRATGNMSRLIQNILLSIGPQFLSMFIGFGFAYTLEPRLATIIVSGMFVYGFISIYTALPIARLQLESNKAWSEAYGDAWDSNGNIYAVKQAGAEARQKDKIFEGFVRKAFAAAMAPEILWDRITFLRRISVVGTQLGVFAGSIYFVAQGSISVGDLVALNGYSALVFGPLANLASNWHMIQNGLTNIHEVGEIMKMAPEAYDRPGGITPNWNGNIEFDQVQFAYPDAPERPVLNNVSFSIRPGETVALVGESGVGKTTIAELVGGYYYPVAGEVRVGGAATTTLSLRALRDHIAVVPQEPILFNDSVINNIRFGRPDATDERVKVAAVKARAHAFIETFPNQYEQKVGERGVKLSVGQKQRIAIARAILRDPKVLILDEPTSALDAKTESEIAGSLETLMKGRTTIVIAHRLSTVRDADKILVFEQGALVEQGTHTELLQKTNGVYKKLHEHQLGLHA